MTGCGRCGALCCYSGNDSDVGDDGDDDDDDDDDEEVVLLLR